MQSFEQSALGEAGALRAIVAQVMEIQDTTYGGNPAPRALPAARALLEGADNYTVRFRGRLAMDSQEAYARVAEQFRPLGYTPLFRKDDQAREGEAPHIVLAIRAVLSPLRTNPWVNVVMLGLTLICVLMAGGLYQYQGPGPGDLSNDAFVATGQALWFALRIGFQEMGNGWPFAVSLLGILLAHELGHYFAARYHKVAVSPPYFIPLPPPLGVFGTMGAVILLKAPPTNRRVLLDIGIAGPLAGFLVAVPVVIIGLITSAPPRPIPLGQVNGFEGNSILYVLLKFLVFGKFLPDPAATDGLPYALFMLRFYVLGMFTPNGGTDVFLNQVAWAGWFGLLVTGLNLIPAGQLDGGHALYVLVGKRAARLVPVIITIMVALGLFWFGWFIWAALIYFLGRTHAEPLDQITEIDPLRRALAIGALVLFVLVITPVPLPLG